MSCFFHLGAEMPLSQPQFSSAAVAARGKALYAESIRDQVETKENIGNLVIIDVETGDYGKGEQQ